MVRQRLGLGNVLDDVHPTTFRYGMVGYCGILFVVLGILSMLAGSVNWWVSAVYYLTGTVGLIEGSYKLYGRDLDPSAQYGVREHVGFALAAVTTVGLLLFALFLI